MPHVIPWTFFGRGGGKANDGGLIQNLVKMTTTKLLRDDFEIMLPINQVIHNRLLFSREICPPFFVERVDLDLLPKKPGIPIFLPPRILFVAFFSRKRSTRLKLKSAPRWPLFRGGMCRRD